MDLSWASAPLTTRIGWRVLEEKQSLFDHRYVVMEVARVEGVVKTGRFHFLRWKATEWDYDKFTVAILSATWGNPLAPEWSGEEEAQWL